MSTKLECVLFNFGGQILVCLVWTFVVVANVQGCPHLMGFFNFSQNTFNLMGFELFCQEDDMWHCKQIFLGSGEEC